MFYRILKKDLKHKRGINFILLLFMILATVFVASSVNNIHVISNATNYCMDKGKVADEYVSTFESEGDKNLGEWLDHNEYVKSYSKNEAVVLTRGNIDSFSGKNGDEYDIDGTIMLQNQWRENMLVFDNNGNPVTLKNGEIGMQQKELDRNGLKLGDSIRFKFGDTYKSFKITTIIRDPAFGGDFVGMTRYIVSDEDFQGIKNTGVTVNYNYNIYTNDKTAFSKAMNKEAFNIIIRVDRDMFAFAYVMSMVSAAILIIIGVCLIIIAFLILRFTIVFTLQEDYKEIGIMKAIGIKNFLIKKIYLVKYFALISIAAVIGCFISVPISNLMLESVSKTMMMENANVNFGINVICSMIVAAIVLLICYLCTNKLRKFSAMEAIRSGQTGERFKRKSIVSLHRSKRLRTPVFMAINDIFSNVKRYVVLILTFTIGTIIMILPMNAITSLGSDEMAKNFMLDLNDHFYINSDTVLDDSTTMLTKKEMQNQLDKVKENFRSKGYDVDLKTTTFYSFSYYVNNEEDAYQVTTVAPLGSDGSYVELLDGTTPINENEIALSEKVMKKMGVKVGDTIHAKIGNTVKQLIITASYQNYMQMGESAFINGKINVDDLIISGSWITQCHLNNQAFNNEVLTKIRDDFPQYTIYDVQQAMSSQLGSTTSQLKSIKLMVVILICSVNLLITILMIKIFIMGEKNQIAMLRSIGYSLRAVRIWQVLRISIVLVIGILLGALCSIPLNTIGLRPIFGMMGATHMKIQVNIVEAYLLYPFMLLIIISLAAYISSSTIKKLNLMEINNAE